MGAGEVRVDITQNVLKESNKFIRLVWSSTNVCCPVDHVTSSPRSLSLLRGHGGNENERGKEEVARAVHNGIALEGEIVRNKGQI